MRINSSAGNQEVALDDSDSGEGLAIFLSQQGQSVARYRFQVKVVIDQGIYDIGEFYGSPPAATAIPGRLSRMIGGAVCPGATGWRVAVSALNVAGESLPPEDEVADVILASSKCCTSPMGVSRVNERYGYDAGASPAATANYSVPGGRTVTGIAALGLSGGGTVVIAGGDTITIPDGISINLEPGAFLGPNSVIAFTNVNFAVEYLESA